MSQEDKELYRIVCDGKDCKKNTGWLESEKSVESKAKELGWSVDSDNDIDYCPECNGQE